MWKKLPCDDIIMTSPWVPWPQLHSLQWRHNGCDGISNHQPHQLRVTGLCAGEFSGDRWIPCTNGQLHGKCFHLMTSSCVYWWLVHQKSCSNHTARWSHNHPSCMMITQHRWYARPYLMWPLCISWRNNFCQYSYSWTSLWHGPTFTNMV